MHRKYDPIPTGSHPRKGNGNLNRQTNVKKRYIKQRNAPKSGASLKEGSRRILYIRENFLKAGLKFRCCIVALRSEPGKDFRPTVFGHFSLGPQKIVNKLS